MSKRSWFELLVGVGCILGGIGGIAAVLALHPFGWFASTSRTNTSTSISSSRSSATSSTSSSTVSVRPEVRKYVDTLEQTSNAANAQMGGLHIGSVRYNHGVSINDQVGLNDGQNGVTFALPGRFGLFRTLVGFDPSSTQGFSGQAAVKVIADDRVVISTNVSTGSPACSIDVPIGNAKTLFLGAFEVGGEPSDVAFGDPRVVAGKDFAGMPTAAPCP